MMLNSKMPRYQLINVILAMAFLQHLFGCSKKPDSDEAVLIELRKAGSDVRKPHDVEFYLYFPSQATAEEAAVRLREKAFQAQVRRAAKGEDWLCLGSKQIIPEL